MLISTELCILCLPCAVSVGHACLGNGGDSHLHTPTIHVGSYYLYIWV
jgi:hypothetical protein